MTTINTCRVCGQGFRSRRFDAITCTSTCRQRFKRGYDLAYLDGLTKREQKAARAYHEATDAWIEAHRRHLAIVRANRAERRAKRQERQREQVLTEIYANITREQLRKEQQHERQRLAGTVAGALKLFAQQQRNDMSAEAIWQFLDMGDRLTVEQITEALDWLRAEGHYDRILAEAIAPPAE